MSLVYKGVSMSGQFSALLERYTLCIIQFLKDKRPKLSLFKALMMSKYIFSSVYVTTGVVVV